MEEKRMVEMGEERTRQQLHTDDEDGFENQELDDRKLLSRYGVWLLVEMSPPKENIPIVRDLIAHILSLNLYSAAHSSGHSVALPVQDPRE